MQQVLCDTSVFVALWAPDERMNQAIFSKQFFDEAKRCTYAINVLDITADEIIAKFPFLQEDYFSLCSQFIGLKKFRQFEAAGGKAILELQTKAKKLRCNLSLNDCALVFAAKKLGILLLSWDRELLAFAEAQGAKAFAPDAI